MKLAVVDNEGRILVEWPTPADAHADIADHVAAAVTTGRFHRAKREATLAAAIRSHLLELQQQTSRL